MKRFKALVMNFLPAILLCGVWGAYMWRQTGWLGVINAGLCMLSGYALGAARTLRLLSHELAEMRVTHDQIMKAGVSVLRAVQSRSPESWPRA